MAITQTLCRQNFDTPDYLGNYRLGPYALCVHPQRYLIVTPYSLLLFGLLRSVATHAKSV